MMHRPTRNTTGRSRALVALSVCSLVAVLTLTTASAGADTTPVLVTRAASGTSYASGSSGGFILSGNGNVVAFDNTGTDLVAGTDSNSTSDVFAYNRLTNTTTLVSRSASSLTTAATGASYVVGISDTGNRILIRSFASNLVAGLGPSGGLSHLFLVDMVANTTELVDHVFGNTAAAPLNEPTDPILSGDGSYVTYASDADNLISGFEDVNGTDRDTYRYNSSTKNNLLVSHAATVPQRGGTAGSAPTAITPNGSRISYQSNANNLITGFSDSNSLGVDVYLWDRTTTNSVLVSHRWDSEVQTGNAPAFGFVTRAGNRVILTSSATTLVSGFVNANGGGTDVFDYGVVSKKTFLVSRSISNPLAGGNVGSLAMNATTTGNLVLLRSNATDLVAGFADLNGGGYDLYAGGRDIGSIRLVSRDSSSAHGANQDVPWGSISADGRAVVFATLASNLVPGYDTSVILRQVFSVTLATATTRLMSGVRGSETRGANSSTLIPIAPPPISNDGGVVTFSSGAKNQVSGLGGVTPANPQIYLNTTGV